MSDELALRTAAETVANYKQATNVAGLCKEIAVKKALDIQGRKYLPVEVWMTIATAHGFMPTVKSVDVLENGMRSVVELRRISDGAVIGSAEGFVGKDEPVWYGGKVVRWNRVLRKEVEVTLEKRPEYAIRAMAQTRGISRVCRTAFAHVVVLMDSGLETVPFEEIGGVEASELDPQDPPAGTSGQSETKREEKKVGGAADSAGAKQYEVPRDETLALREQFRNHAWEAIKIHFGKNEGVCLGKLEDNQLKWYIDKWVPRPSPTHDDVCLRAALDVAAEEAFK